jgi:hypothetical protein
MDQGKPRAERPLWVKAAVWGLPTQVSVWSFFWLSIALAIVSVAYGFWDVRFFAGGLFVFPALWYYLAIRWVDQHDHWS